MQAKVQCKGYVKPTNTLKKSPKCVYTLTQNIQCLSNKKILQVRDTLQNNDFDILLFSEHWQSEANINLIKIPNFELADFYARKNACRVGTCIFVKDNLGKYEKISGVQALCTEFHFEVSCIKFIAENLIFCSFYRSPDGDIDIFLSKLEDLLQLLTKNNKSRIVIAGDFNINFVVDNNISSQCINMFTSFGFVKQIDASTRFSKTTATCIDNVFTNFDSTQSDVVDLDLSDHCGIKSNFHMNPKPSSAFGRFRSKVNDTNIAKAKNDLKGINFVDILNNAPLKNKFGVFSELFETVVNKYMPITEKKKKQYTNTII